MSAIVLPGGPRALIGRQSRALERDPAELVLERFEPVVFEIANLYLGEAAEVLLPGIRDIELPRRMREKLRKGFEVVLMASGKGDTYNADFRNHYLGAVTILSPGTNYWAIWTTAATTNLKTYVGNTAGEVTGGSYARVGKTANTTNFPSIVGSAAIVNGNAITWTTASADWNSGTTLKQFIVLDGNAGSSADKTVVWGDFTVAKSVLNGDTAQINASSFSWSET